MNKKFNQVLIIFIFYSFNIFISCVGDPEILDMDYDTIALNGVDNSGEYLLYNSNTDIMYSEAVAIKLILSDTSDGYSLLNNVKDLFSFQKANATSLPDPYYLPVNSVESIAIYTLLDINETILAGDQVNSNIYYVFKNDGNHLYNDADPIDYFNSKEYYLSRSVVLILNTAVDNDAAQFRIDVTFEDGTVFSETTNLFTIIPSEI